MKQRGFTVIEIIVVAIFLIVAGVILTIQVDKINKEYINQQKKVAINAIYYSLEEDFYAKNKYYPEKIEKNTLPTMDSELLTDPNGVMINDEDSDYRYIPTNCQKAKCKSYSLRTTVDGEDDFIKESRNK